MSYKKIKKTVKNLNIEEICNSGQCFRMEAMENGRYRVLAKDRCLEIEQKGEVCTFFCEEADFETFWKPYFDLERDYALCISKIPAEDLYLTRAARFGSGIRILKQDLWEMMVSFLISQQNNIVRIRRCIQNICEKYGEERPDMYGNTYYSFPKPEVLAELDEDELKACNLGYRSKYVVRTARSVVTEEINLEKVAKMDYAAAKEELLKLFGVGEKVADCICLFALHQMQAFPVDTHIRQALEQNYADGFPMEQYEGMQGILQQYIFYYELKGKKEQENV